MSGELLGFGEDGTARLRHSCHKPAGLDRLSGAMLESVYEYPLQANAARQFRPRVGLRSVHGKQHTVGFRIRNVGNGSKM